MAWAQSTGLTWPSPEQALAAFDDFLANRLPAFGPYEDAMSSRHRTLYHSAVSPYLNLGLLEPLEWCRPPSKHTVRAMRR